jgi:dihydrofolate reductase
VNTLLPHNLIDEFRIMVFPVVIGSGKKLFRDRGEKTDLTLTESRTTRPALHCSPISPPRRTVE